MTNCMTTTPAVEVFRGSLLGQGGPCGAAGQVLNPPMRFAGACGLAAGPLRASAEPQAVFAREPGRTKEDALAGRAGLRDGAKPGAAVRCVASRHPI
jgi:hypothetical protein